MKRILEIIKMVIKKQVSIAMPAFLRFPLLFNLMKGLL